MARAGAQVVRGGVDNSFTLQPSEVVVRLVRLLGITAGVSLTVLTLLPATPAAASGPLVTTVPVASGTAAAPGGELSLAGRVEVVAVDAHPHGRATGNDADHHADHHAGHDADHEAQHEADHAVGHGGSGVLVTRTLVVTPDRVVAVPGALARGLRSGQQVRVGVRAGATAAPARTTMASGPVEDVALSVTPVAPSRTRLAATVLGRHRLTVLPVFWHAPDKATQASLTATARETAAYWSEQSAGRISIAAVVRDWARIAAPADCTPQSLMNAALAAHGVGAPGSLTDHVLVYFPRRADCPWAGLGSIGGSLMWSNGYQLPDVVAHEFGHNLGLGHANTASCRGPRGRVPLSASCTVHEYQDATDVMGVAGYGRTGNLNAAFADHLGLARAVTATPRARTVVDLAPLARTAALRAVRIPVAGGTVVIGFRPAVGRDVRRTAWAGVQVHLRTAAPSVSTRLLDMQPWSASAFRSPALAPYAVWPVPGAGLSVRVTRVTATGARVEIVPTGQDAVRPSAPALLSPSTGAHLAGAVRVRWSGARDSGSGVAAYTVLLNGVPVARTAPSARSAVLRSVPDGTHRLQVQAVDAAGNASPARAAQRFRVTGAR